MTLGVRINIANYWTGQEVQEKGHKNKAQTLKSITHLYVNGSHGQWVVESELSLAMQYFLAIQLMLMFIGKKLLTAWVVEYRRLPMLTAASWSLRLCGSRKYKHDLKQPFSMHVLDWLALVWLSVSIATVLPAWRWWTDNALVLRQLLNDLSQHLLEQWRQDDDI